MSEEKWEEIAFQQLAGIKIVCERCKHQVNINYSYRCFDCNFWFCRDCAMIHFKKEEEIKRLKNRIKKLNEYCDIVHINTE